MGFMIFTQHTTKNHKAAVLAEQQMLLDVLIFFTD